MGIMVYSLLRVMQDFVHQPYVLETSFLKPSILGPTLVSPKRGPEP